ncbi:MBL fold metallo-hydrolase [Ectothiorhodospiraceae bacterium BW-2]|nr:MBL fold metallo-hydrolase [Ectothiorhodospiraceae bacterium BW-2]
MRFNLLGSGSRGNATLVEFNQTRILIDCGFTLKEIESRLATAATEPASLSAILVTHEHGDHLNGVGPLARKYRLPVYLTAGSYLPHRLGTLPQVTTIHSHNAPFAIGELEITPYTIPHDAKEACHYTLSNGNRRLGLLTDAGHITPHIVAHLNGCDGLILECNHDPQLLRQGPYPPSLQARVGGELGHLSNQQAASLLQRLDQRPLQQLVLAHLSAKNNHPDRVREAILPVVACSAEALTIASQDHPSGWRELRQNSI